MLRFSKGKVLVLGAGGTGFGTATRPGMKRAQIIPIVLCKCFGVSAVIVMK